MSADSSHFRDMPCMPAFLVKTVWGVVAGGGGGAWCGSLNKEEAKIF